MEIIALPFLLLVGGLLAVQGAANVQLAGAMTSPFGASTLQLGIGAALLLVLAAAGGSLGALALLDDAPPWELLGGLGSALYITAGILLFPRVGALVAVALFIAGQMLASLLLDDLGWLGVAQEPFTAAAGLGGAAVIAGAWLIAGARSALPARGAWLSLGLAAGAALPVQGAVNAQLRTDVDAPAAAALVSFLVATAAMALVLAVALSLRSTPRPRLGPLRGMPWWGWLGGAVGATYVTSVFVLLPEIGAAPTIGLTVAGQQIASVLVDRHGLLRLPRRPITGRRLTGVAVLLAGVALVQLG